MSYIVEDPWPLGFALILVASASLIALKITGQGKFLIWVLGAGGLAALLFVVEALWVTDNERIEQVVSDIARAASRGDVEGVMVHLSPNLSLEQEGSSIGEDQAKGLLPKLGARVAAVLGKGEAARALIRATLEEARFDFIHIGQMQVEVRPISHLGTAEFRAFGSGTIPARGTVFTFATDASGTDWKFSFEETSPGVWKVTNIAALRLPAGASLAMFGGGRGR